MAYSTRGSTFKAQHRPDSFADLYSALPFNRNGCMAFALARALSDDPADDVAVSEMAALVVETLGAVRSTARGYGKRGFDHKGSHWGGLRWAMSEVGLGDHEWRSGWGEITRREPVRTYSMGGGATFTTGGTFIEHNQQTVAQWIRANPDVTEAIFSVRGHVAYYKDGISYGGLGARCRVEAVAVLASTSAKWQGREMLRRR